MLLLMSTIVEADETGTLHLPPSPAARPWMELAGSVKGESEELRRIEQVIVAEFEVINPEEWR